MVGQLSKKFSLLRHFSDDENVTGFLEGQHYGFVCSITRAHSWQSFRSP